MSPHAFLQGVSTLSLSLLAPAVQAVGGGGYEKVAAHLLNGGILYNMEFVPLKILSSGKQMLSFSTLLMVHRRQY